MTQKLNYGEIWIANLNPGKGTEPGKTRPVLVIQTQALLDVNHPSTLIVPLTTNLINNAEPLRVRVKAGDKLEQDSDLLIDQIRAIDNKRFLEGPLLKCEEDLIKKILECVHEIIDGF
jgi:mRNA interferase MazF